uniref:Uncharacterized protein n=1 Tax=Globodera rostochiensis TaxID=31243 RepID=A0A914HSA0_GLORO
MAVIGTAECGCIWSKPAHTTAGSGQSTRRQQQTATTSESYPLPIPQNRSSHPIPIPSKRKSSFKKTATSSESSLPISSKPATSSGSPPLLPMGPLPRFLPAQQMHPPVPLPLPPGKSSSKKTAESSGPPLLRMNPELRYRPVEQQNAAASGQSGRTQLLAVVKAHDANRERRQHPNHTHCQFLKIRRHHPDHQHCVQWDHYRVFFLLLGLYTECHGLQLKGRIYTHCHRLLLPKIRRHVAKCQCQKQREDEEELIDEWRRFFRLLMEQQNAAASGQSGRTQLLAVVKAHDANNKRRQHPNHTHCQFLKIESRLPRKRRHYPDHHTHCQFLKTRRLHPDHHTQYQFLQSRPRCCVFVLLLGRIYTECHGLQLKGRIYTHCHRLLLPKIRRHVAKCQCQKQREDEEELIDECGDIIRTIPIANTSKSNVVFQEKLKLDEIVCLQERRLPRKRRHYPDHHIHCQFLKIRRHHPDHQHCVQWDHYRVFFLLLGLYTECHGLQLKGRIYTHCHRLLLPKIRRHVAKCQCQKQREDEEELIDEW